MDLVVPFSESDVTKISVGQPATVTVNALPDSQLAAHVTSISTLSTTNSSVVSYDVTFHLDQLEPGIKPGMTASAEVVVQQAVGAISVPSSAITGDTVTVRRNGKDVTQPVVTGIVGDTTTQVISGLKVGDEIVIRTISGLGSSAGTSAGGAAAGGFAGGGLGGAAIGGGGFAGGGGGGARFFRGGG
jgi:multidrug efflux pump subunit AcrA (membrane-fusion protein)